MKIKCDDGKTRTFTISRYREGIFGVNILKCIECGHEDEQPKCSTTADLRDIAKEHACEKGDSDERK